MENTKYKIKIKKDFDIKNEKEISSFYIKKKMLLGWWYIHDDDDESFYLIYFYSILLDILFIFLLKFINEDVIGNNILQLNKIIIILLCLRLFWLYFLNTSFKKDFLNEVKAMDYIKNNIRKTNFKKNNKSKEIKVSYNIKTEEIEVEKEI